MANTTSAKKATRKIARRTEINKSRRSQMRGAVRSVEDAIKRGDEVTLSNGVIGKVTRVDTDVAMVEISQGVNVKVVKSMIQGVGARPAVAANDTKKIAKS